MKTHRKKKREAHVSPNSWHATVQKKKKKKELLITAGAKRTKGKKTRNKDVQRRVAARPAQRQRSRTMHQRVITPRIAALPPPLVVVLRHTRIHTRTRSHTTHESTEARTRAQPSDVKNLETDIRTPQHDGGAIWRLSVTSSPRVQNAYEPPAHTLRGSMRHAKHSRTPASL